MLYSAYSSYLLLLLTQYWYVAHNGFPIDFIFLVAEVKRRKLDEIFNSITLYFANTLYDAKRVKLQFTHKVHLLAFVYTSKLVKSGHPLFAEWSPNRTKKLGLENLFKKCYPNETYNGKNNFMAYKQFCWKFLAHHALEDIKAMQRFFPWVR